FIMTRGNEEILRQDARVFSEDDIIAASDELRRVSNLNATDVDQSIAELIEPIRNMWLRSQDRAPEENTTERPQAVMPRYRAVLPGAEGEESREPSIRDMHKNQVLANFVLLLGEDIEVQDDIESRHEFAGKLMIFDRTVPFRIAAKDFADNGKFKAALFDAGGCELVIHCGMDELRKAVSTLSKQNGSVRVRRLTTNFGWTDDKTMYLTPTIRVSASAVEELDKQCELRVDLGTETPACCLDLRLLKKDELLRVKRHVVEDLLTLHDSMVTH